jgi:hypothetical protein
LALKTNVEQRVPEEIMHSILKQLLATTETELCQFPTGGRPRWMNAPRPAVTCSNLLLVCKRWLRIGTPMLYAFMCLSKPRHTRALACALGADPSLAEHTCVLRLEGGINRDLCAVATRFAHVPTLYVSMHGVERLENVIDLVQAVPALEPKTTYLHYQERFMLASALNKVEDVVIAAMCLSDGLRWWVLRLGSTAFSG